MLRDVFEDEYTGEKNALKVYRFDGKNNKSKIPVKLDKDKHYQLIFICKTVRVLQVVYRLYVSMI